MQFKLSDALSFLKKTRGGEGTGRSVGIDIGASAIKVVELKNVNDTITLSTYGELDIGPHLEQDLGAIVKLEPEKMTEALAAIWAEAGVVASRGVLSVPLASSFLTTVSIEHTNEEDIDLNARIPVEAKKYIPLPLREVSLDWFEAEQTLNPETSMLTRNIIMAAIQNQVLAQLQALLNTVHLETQPTEIETFSAVRASIKDYNLPAIIIDLGASMSKLYVTKGQTLQKIHRVRSGGVHVTERLAELRSVPFGQAELIKRQAASDELYAKDVKTALSATMERPFQEFKRVIQQYQTNQKVEFSQVLLIGGGAQLDQMSEYVTEQLSLPVEVVNPFVKVAYPAFLEDTLAELGSSFAVALGAALRLQLEK